jgi:hypothetical protein
MWSSLSGNFRALLLGLVEAHRFSDDGDPCYPLDRHATRWGIASTEASGKPVPLDLRLSKVLWSWRLQSPSPIDED